MTAASASAVRDAASVVLIRDGELRVEAFTLTRASTMEAFPNATVFPGGGSDVADELPTPAWEGVDLGPWMRAFDDDESTVRRLLVTAVRETFEESGVLLAEPTGTSMPSTAQREAGRRALENHQLSLSQFLTDHGLAVDFSRLRPLSRWVTPEGNPRRFDTRFFLAQLPPDQDAIGTSGEAAGSQWMSPSTAFELFRAGNTQLMPPTWSQFRRLSEFESTAAALRAELQPQRVRPVMVRGTSPARVSFPYAEEYYAE